MKTIAIITLLLFSLSGIGQTQVCANVDTFHALSKTDLNRKSDSIAKILSAFWKEKARMEKLGLSIDNFEIQALYFGQNCETTRDLDHLYHVINVMQKNDNINVEVVGNMDSKEEMEHPLISKQRANFIKKILVLNNIPPKRITITDAKSDRPAAPKTKMGQKENRRVEFYIMN